MGAPATGPQDFGKLLLRLVIGGTLLVHGYSKIVHGIPFIHQAVAGKGLPDVLSYGVYIGEVLGPVLVILGLLGRLGALFIAIDLGFAIFLVKAPHFAELTQVGGWMLEPDAQYLVGALAILFLGSGRFALSRGHGRLD